jgi:GTPase SAR1 family protein
MGEEMKKVINAQAYVECSPRVQYNLNEVFETAIKVVLHPPPRLWLSRRPSVAVIGAARSRKRNWTHRCLIPSSLPKFQCDSFFGK